MPCGVGYFPDRTGVIWCLMGRFMGLGVEGRKAPSPTLRLLLVLSLPVRPVWWWGLALLSLMAFSLSQSINS